MTYFDLQKEIDRYRRPKGKGKGKTPPGPPPPGRSTLPPAAVKAASRYTRPFSAVNYRTPGIVPPLRQPKSADCWATTFAMLYCWRQNASTDIRTAVSTLGPKFLKLFDENSGLPGSDNPAFIAAAGLVSEPPMSYTPEGWEGLLRNYGPVIVTTDNGNLSDQWLHARVLVGIAGDGTADGTNMQLVDPGTGSEYSTTLTRFLTDYESSVNVSIPFQIVHWPVGGAVSQSASYQAYSAPTARYSRPFHLPPLAYGKRVSQAFRDKVRTICGNLGCDPDFLMAAMAFETGETFSPSVKNSQSGATGLIQFMPKTAKGLGTTTADLAKMTAEDQLDYVERYFAPQKGRLNSLEDVYMAILWPAAVGKANDYALFSRPSKAYEQNKGLDADGDGSVTKAEAAAAVRKRLDRGLKPENAA